MAAVASDVFHATHLSGISSKIPILVPGGAYELTPDDCGAIVFMLVAGIVTLPLVADVGPGYVITLINEAADGVAEAAFSPQAADAIIGSIANTGQDSVSADTAGQDWENTGGTAILGDRCTLISDGGTMWYIIEGVGIWVTET